MGWTIGKKLLWSIGIPALVVALSGVGIFWKRTNDAVAHSTREEADAVAELIATAFTLADGRVRPAPGHDPRIGVHRAVTAAFQSEWRAFEHIEALRIVGLDGRVVWSRTPAEQGQPFPASDEWIQLTARSERIYGGHAEVIRPLGGMACASCHEGQAMKVGVLQVAVDQPRLREEVTSVFITALVSVIAFAAVLALATALSLHYFLARPLAELSAAMKRAEDGDLLARAQTGARDEFSRLGHSFNDMLAKLTAMKAEELDTQRDLLAAQEKLSLQAALQDTNAQLQHRVRALTLIYDVARSFTSTLELPELLSRITELIARQLDIPQFSIMLASREGRLDVKSAFPANAGTEEVSFAFGEGAAGIAAQSRTSVYLQDLSLNSAIYIRHRPDEEGSLLSVPMIHKEEVIGVLNFQRPTPRAFSSEEIELLTAVADQAALAVKNARLHEETVALSLTDPLTGAPNRRHLVSRLEVEIARANRFGNQVSILMVDIDHFKLLNDTVGHRAGDVVLRQIYELMARMVRKVDLIARYGGEEFVVVLAQVPKAEAVDVGEKLRRAVAESTLQYGRTQPGGHVTISIGVSNLPVDATELDRLVDCADAALYASKRDGRDRVTAYAPGMEQHPGRSAAALKKEAPKPAPAPPPTASQGGRGGE